MDNLRKGDIHLLLWTFGIKSPVEEVLYLSGGMDNLNIYVRTHKGKYVIRQYKRTLLRDVYFEIELISHLLKHRFPTPRIFPTKEGEYITIWKNYPTALFEFIHGESAPNPTSEQAYKAGVVLGRYHEVIKHYQPKQVKDYWDLFELTHLSDQKNKVAKSRIENINLLLEDARKFTANIQPVVTQALKELPIGVIHFDLRPENILWRKNGIVSVLDFDTCYMSNLVTDVVATIIWWGFEGETKPKFNPLLAQKIWRGYTSTRNLSAKERQFIYPSALTIIFMGAISYILDHLGGPNRITDVYQCGMYHRYKFLQELPHLFNFTQS